MRILVLTSTFPRSDADSIPRFVQDLCIRLAARNDITVLAPHMPGASASERIEGVKVERFRYAPERLEVLAGEGGILAGLRKHPWRVFMVPVFLLAQLGSATSLIRRENFDLVHAHWILPQALIALIAIRFSKRRPLVLCTCHGGDVFALSSPLLKRLKRQVLNRCDRITVVSKAMSLAVGALAPEKAARTVIAPMGADLEKLFVPGETPRSRETILFVGRLAEKKGVNVLISAMPDVLRVHPSVRLRIVGQGPMREELVRLAVASGVDRHIDWLGGLDHVRVAREYRTAALLAFPSQVASDGDQEGLGLVPIEAAGCHCPVVASDLSAIRDVIEDERTGLLVPAGDSQSLAAAIVRLLNEPDLGKQLAVQGAAYVHAHFSWSVVAKRYEDLIESMVGRTSSSTGSRG